MIITLYISTNDTKPFTQYFHRLVGLLNSKKSKYEKMKSFSNDLQGILDTQFNNGIMAKKERNEDIEEVVL